MIAARNPEPRGRSSTRAAPPPARNPAGIAAAPVWLLKIRRSRPNGSLVIRAAGKRFLTRDAMLFDSEIRVANFNHKCTGISYKTTSKSLTLARTVDHVCFMIVGDVFQDHIKSRDDKICRRHRVDATRAATGVKARAVFGPRFSPIGTRGTHGGVNSIQTHDGRAPEAASGTRRAAFCGRRTRRAARVSRGK